MKKWFRSGLPPHQTALAMLGAKAGQAVVFLGSADPDFAAEVGRVTGLNGRTVVVDDVDRADARVEAAAARAGALVEFDGRPPADSGLDADQFDVAAVTVATWAGWDEPARAACAREALRVVRPGGRVVIVLSGGRPSRLLGAKPVPQSLADAAMSLLTAAGARAVRVLAEVPGTTYVEAARARST